MVTTVGSPAVRATARRLLSVETQQHGNSDEAAAHVEHVLAQVCRSLSEWVGSAGCHALFDRAITLAAVENPALLGVRHRERPSPHFDRIAENAREHGAEATVEAATTVLISVIATLSGLIGEDIALSLLDGMGDNVVATPGVGTRTASTTSPHSNPATASHDR